ncbi:MAG: murein L,D-transpeptidase catalytic domain family protein [Chitinophagales bacterium]|nr:murein L,D-transpeptidase catalytic domain family protein [Bacteroidota bacterium]MCB9042636.1 murein L,D-transpeptidase catalytic domain family protein [Chitinophagales bacterium]
MSVRLFYFAFVLLLFISNNTINSGISSNTNYTKPQASQTKIANNNTGLFETYIKRSYDNLQLGQKKLHYEAYKNGLIGYYNLLSQNKVAAPKYLSIADFEQASTEKRLYIIDVQKNTLVKQTWVAHGKNSGNNFAQNFSNTAESYQSSLGFYLTAETYSGKHGYSLRFDGIEQNINDRARERAIVMHGADYVSKSFIQQQGRLGRSFGCPAVSEEESAEIINLIKDGSVFYIYKNDKSYLQLTHLLQYSIALTAYERLLGTVRS